MSQEPSPTLLALAAAYPHDPAHLHKVIIPQFEHRLRLASLWSIAPSSRVLDIGCGQGDSALVLAHAITPPSDSPSAPAGHVTGLDPAPGSYGSPYTLDQAHAHILASDYGSRISFHRADAGSYLGDHRTEKFDVATLCHSLWYFGSRSEIFALFEALYLSGQVDRVCMAEYVSKADKDKPSQIPHEIAVEAQRRYYYLRRDRDSSEANVREAVDPEEMLSLAESAKWTVRESGVVDTPGLLDGRWEVAAVLDPAWAEEVKSKKLGPGAEEELLGYVEKIKKAVAELKKKGEEAATLDAKWAVMERSS